MIDLSDKSYLIVGGSSGIGLKVASDLVSQNADVLVWSRNTSEGLAALGVKHIAVDVTADLENPELPENLDGIVYCPGTIRLGQFRRLSAAQFREDLEINLLGAVKTLQFAEKPLKARGGGSIVLFSTVAVQTGMTFHTSIAAAKGAVEGFVRALAAEYAVHSIRVNAIAPSITDTPLASGILSGEKQRQASADRHPLKRIGSVHDMASAAVFLLGPESGWITGQILHVDGGLSAIR